MTLTRRRLLGQGSVALAGLALGSVGCGRFDPAALGLWPAEPPPPTGPFVAPAGKDAAGFWHLLQRTSFGPRPEDLGRLLARAADPGEAAARHLAEQLHPETIPDEAADYALRRLETLDLPAGELFEVKPEVLRAEVTRAAVLRAALSRRQLYEVMVHFWTDHFNIALSKGDCQWLKVADDREVIRRHTLGRFPELLRASALSPAMLWYLDGRVNRRAEPAERPNENYARELLELHTLGVDGGYDQRDVMEAARCLTGWTVRSEESRFGIGRVEFHPELHDPGRKQVLGVTIPSGLGAGDVDRLLAIVALHPATARHLATKLCRHFLADDPDPAAVAAVAARFLASGGDIRETLATLFAHPAFPRAAGGKLKRPFHYLVSALRATGARTDGGAAIDEFLLAMGHAPFQYPTPDGYPEAAAPWQGALMGRFRLAVALAHDRIAGTEVELGPLAAAFGGAAGLFRHLLGRPPRGAEAHLPGPLPHQVALLLASPAFQRF